MADTLLEQTRALHEDVERLERLIVLDFKGETKTHKERLAQNHRVRRRLDAMQGGAKKLLRIYADEDGARKEEIAALAQPDTGSFSNFYDRLKDIKDYYRRFPTTDVTEAENPEQLLKEDMARGSGAEFTGDEGLGRYLDLHEHHQRFVSAHKTFGRKVEYYDYAAAFASDLAPAPPGGSKALVLATAQAPGWVVPKQYKGGRQYREYLEQLYAYLMTFYEKTQPLGQAAKQLKKLEEDVRGRWASGEVAGWEDRGLGQVAGSSGAGGLDMDAFDTMEELESLGAGRLKEALLGIGLKSGGTLRERAARLYLTKGVPLSQLDRKHFAKGVVVPTVAAAVAGTAGAAAVTGASSKGGVDAEAAAKRMEAGALQVCLLELKIQKLAEILGSVITETRGRIEKKQAQTYEELQAEQEEAEAELAPEDEDDEDDFVYNPLKLPLGWDGKPIPYWLYKLHGLNQEFKCEICGNYSYWGRRAFEKHFKEWRHQNGMRSLGIPNNKNFYEVTKIADAQSLWANIQDKAKGGFHAEVDEEFEDAQGNVYNRKTFEDLRRQGLI